MEDLLSACAGLVIVDEATDVIRLVHYTTQEFFERTRKRWFPDASANLTNLHITCLSFYDYAVHNWDRHARKGCGDRERILDLLLNDAKKTRFLVHEARGKHPNKNLGPLDLQTITRSLKSVVNHFTSPPRAVLSTSQPRFVNAATHQVAFVTQRLPWLRPLVIAR
jgi:hypothetical protein